MDYKFTQDWFHWAPKVWKHLTPMLPDRKSFLEIGAFEGRATTWIIENMMSDGGEIICIDTWEGGEEHVNGEMELAKANFNHNIETVRKKFPNRNVTAFTGLSSLWIPCCIQNDLKFDFIYIDGSHIAKDVLTDACMSWPMLKKDGIMVFDDYLWGDMSRPNHVPKSAIDAFVNIFIEELNIIHLGYQFIVRKTK